MHNLVLIEKVSPSSDSWSNLIKDKTILELTVEEIVNRYKGFEGEMVCIFNIEENESDLEKFINQCLELKMLSKCLLLHVISDFETMSSVLKKQTVFMGYDIGVCEEENIYSSIFNEVLFGGYEELTFYKDILNENLLLPDKATAKKYVELHNRMSAQGKNVEDYMEMIIYEIWEHVSPKPESLQKKKK